MRNVVVFPHRAEEGETLAFFTERLKSFTATTVPNDFVVNDFVTCSSTICPCHPLLVLVIALTMLLQMMISVIVTTERAAAELSGRCLNW